MQGTLEWWFWKRWSAAQCTGYGIVKESMKLLKICWELKDGSLYPALYRMEERGWITSEWGVSENNRRAKFYQLTSAGRKQLEAECANWERISQAITKNFASRLSKLWKIRSAFIQALNRRMRSVKSKTNCFTSRTATEEYLRSGMTLDEASERLETLWQRWAN